MPELPEVETIKRQLAPRVESREICDLEVFDPRWCKPVNPEQLEVTVKGMHIEGISRRGKYLILDLNRTGEPEARSFLIMHLRMTGSLLFAEARPKYSRAHFQLDDGASIYFVDARRFGHAEILADRDALSEYFNRRLGVEPLSDQFTVDCLETLTRGRARPVKSFLLDQSKVAGIGNIYADEALFRAGIHPTQPAGTLKRAELAKLHAGILDALNAGIDLGGASIDSFRHYDGGEGEMQDEFLVHRREGRACPNCGGKIKKFRLVGRGTYFCRSCQKPRRRKLRAQDHRQAMSA